jgi:Na+-translocating ferredoxin:NAD+ oxidoreductase RnfC subunit
MGTIIPFKEKTPTLARTVVNEKLTIENGQAVIFQSKKTLYLHSKGQKKRRFDS